MEDRPFLNTKEVAQFLDVNEKMIYALVSDKGLPATKVTGKWLFPRRLVERWLEGHITNFSESAPVTHCQNVLILVGSHDILLERTVDLFNLLYPEYIAVFGNVGSLGGLKALGRGLCHGALCHLIQENEKEYNFDSARQELGGKLPAVVNFCKRQQGIIVAKGNPKGIEGVSDLARSQVKLANRPKGTGTRLLLDRELEKLGLNGMDIDGYQKEFRSHLDVAMEVLTGRADVAPAIKSAASLLGLDFIPLRWERYDLLIAKDRFFEQGVQNFLGLLYDPRFHELAEDLGGYDLSLSGKMVFPQQSNVS
ncbi:MAG: helix-turn-helix transcriptional regulator [Deltaproteobacteria bacterium]|nr:helix-turn-helix transcriptional regulator [Deltaproteobacteria bacterium]